MTTNLRHNCVALSILLWMIIGSSARIHYLAGAWVLTIFLLCAVAYGARALSPKQIFGGFLGFIFVALYCVNSSFEPFQIIFFIIELGFFFIILSRPGNFSGFHLGVWIAIYSISLLVFKVGISGHSVFQRENSLLNGPIKYGMISSIGYACLLFRKRVEKYPSLFEICIIFLLFIAVISSLSRSTIAFTFLATAYYFLRQASTTYRVIAIIVPIIIWEQISDTRIFYLSDTTDTLALQILRERYIAWEDAIIVIKLDLILGPGNELYQQYNRIALEYPHNIFLDILVNSGLIGFVCITIMILSIIRRWNYINIGVFIVSLFSGNIFLWIKCIFVFNEMKPRNLKPNFSPVGLPPARHHYFASK